MPKIKWPTKYNRYFSIGDYHVGPYCGERIFNLKHWLRRPLFKKDSNSFSIGPILFWKEKINEFAFWAADATGFELYPWQRKLLSTDKLTLKKGRK